MPKKITLEMVKEEAERRGYKLKSKEYIRSSSKMNFICLNGHEYVSSWNNFRRGNGCRKGPCNKHRIKFDKVKKDIEDKGFILLDSEYVDVHTPMNVECPNKHKVKMSYGNLVLQNKGCLVCYNEEVSPSIEYLKKYFKSVGYDLLSDEYVNNYTYLKYKCSMGHESRSTWSSFKGGSRCVYCQREDHKVGIEEVSAELMESGYNLVRATYSMAKDSFDVICPKGHKTGMYIYNFRKGCRCGECDKENKVSKSEKELVGFVRSIYGGDVSENDRTIISPYELDVFIPAKNLAIEYCGLYWHSDFNGKNKFYHYNKTKLCADKGIRLITVFEDEYLENKETVLRRIKEILGDSKKTFPKKIGNRIELDLRWDIFDESYFTSSEFSLCGVLEPSIYKRIEIKKNGRTFYGNIWDCGKKVYYKV